MSNQNENEELPGMLALAKGVQEGAWPHTMDAQGWAHRASLAEAAMRKVEAAMREAELADARAAIANATGDDDAAPECTCAAKDMTFGRCCKVTPNAELTGGAGTASAGLPG